MKTKSWGMSLLLLFATALPLHAGDIPSFNIMIKDHRFNPETVEVPAGKKVKLIVKNEGPGAEEFESHDLKREKVIKAGKSAVIYIGPLNPGTYKFFGEFNPKTAQGQIVAK